jgi:hypothetical protein
MVCVGGGWKGSGGAQFLRLCDEYAVVSSAIVAGVADEVPVDLSPGMLSQPVLVFSVKGARDPSAARQTFFNPVEFKVPSSATAVLGGSVMRYPSPAF